MNLINPIKSLLHPKQTREVFLSLVLTRDSVAASAWYVDAAKKPVPLAFAKTDIPGDTWEDRTKAADQTVAKIEEKLDESSQIQKAVLGLPADFLTQTGDIDPSVRSHIKQLTQALDLTPIGFVSLPQALVYKLKNEEGMPPSVILLGFSDHQIVLTLYKVGAIVGQHIIDQGEHLATSLEMALKHFKELEVLPSRILLYGMRSELLEEGKAQLMRHPWPTKANFLHFPKFDELSAEEVATAVSLAGASEIAQALGEEVVEAVAAAAKEPEPPVTPASPSDRLVAAEELGFQKEDILEEVKEKTQKFRLPVALPAFKLPKLSALPITLPRIKLRGGAAIAGIILGVLLLFGVLNWIIPKATVTVLATPQTIKSQLTLTVDPTATTPDSQNKIIPGHTREDALSGEKVIAVSGTKKVGDPAKGGVTIYNKSLTAKSFKKGSILSASGLNFTLDGDVQVASASESVGSITFGKTTGAITAEAIGSESNLPAGTEFTFKDTSSSVAIARNDQPLAGGTSREVTVVTRSDYDALVSELTDELLTQAKEKLATSISGGEKLLDPTLKTTVTEKVFAQELDQEAKELSGKITVTVSGVSYGENDLAVVFEDSIRDKLQPGYALAKDRTETNIQNVQVKKDGKITLTASITGVALPSIDNDTIRKTIAGKSMAAAQEYLKATAGVGGVEFRFRWTIIPNRLPVNKQNISVTVAVQ